MEPRRELIREMLDKYSADELVLAVVQVGSTAKGYDDEHSDVDLEVVVTEDKYAEQAKNFQKIIHTERYDLIFTTISKLRQVKDSEVDEDHWEYQNSIVLLDKTHTVQGILDEITRYDEASRIDRLKRYYCAYWEDTLSSWGCIEHGNDVGARIYVALAVRELIRLLFNFNHLWAPRLQWAFKEIPMLQAGIDELQTQLDSILKQPETGRLSRLWNQTVKLLQKEKYSWSDHPEELL